MALLWTYSNSSASALLNLTKFSWVLFSSLFRSLWIATLPSVISAVLLLRTPLITALHLDIEPLTTYLWLWPSDQFLIHWTVQPSNPYLSNLREGYVEGLELYRSGLETNPGNHWKLFNQQGVKERTYQGPKDYLMFKCPIKLVIYRSNIKIISILDFILDYIRQIQK